MRLNENEIIANLAFTTPDWEGILNYRPPKGGGGFVRGQNEYKERWFRLRANFLFYWRISDPHAARPAPGVEPMGVLILEHCHVQPEGFAETVHAFSIIFHEDSDKKHMFLTESSRQVQQWTTAIKGAHYEGLRERLMQLQIKISNRTGRDPLMGTGFDNNPLFNPKAVVRPVMVEFDPKDGSSPKAKPRKSRVRSTFQSHVVESWEKLSGTGTATDNNESEPFEEKKASFQSHVPEGNLVDLG